jgi:putrescine transport system ATP-binding protein
VGCPEAGCELLVDDLGRVNTGQRVWVALRPEKIRLSKTPPISGDINQLQGVVWELGYLGNRSTYRIKMASGKVLTVLAQNDQRTSQWSIDWSDEVYLSWNANAAIVLQC